MYSRQKLRACTRQKVDVSFTLRVEKSFSPRVTLVLRLIGGSSSHDQDQLVSEQTEGSLPRYQIPTMIFSMFTIVMRL